MIKVYYIYQICLNNTQSKNKEAGVEREAKHIIKSSNSRKQAKEKL